MNDYDFWFERGHVALITGASKGFGFAVAQCLAQQGIALTITARHADELEAAAEQLRGLVAVEAIAGDVRDLAHVHRLVERTHVRFGRLDLLVNNASTIGRSPLHLIQHALPAIVQSGGTIVNVSSDAAVNARIPPGAATARAKRRSNICRAR